MLVFTSCSLQYHAQMEGKLPEYNTRVKLPQTQRDNVYDGKCSLIAFSVSSVPCLRKEDGYEYSELSTI